MHVAPYLNFQGRCQEALDFYRETVGAEVTMLMHFKDAPEPPPPGALPPGYGEKVMHSNVVIGNTRFMATDGGCSAAEGFRGFSMALSVRDDAEAKRCFDALGQGGKVQMPLAKTFFSSSFGLLEDKFGVSWMVVVEA